MMSFFYLARYYRESGESLLGAVKKAARAVRRNK